MSDLIRREDVLKTMSKDQWYFIKPREQIERINAIPSAEPKKGHWIEPTSDMIHNHICGSCEIICSSCNETAIDEYNYCPNCGAKMERRADVSKSDM